MKLDGIILISTILALAVSCNGNKNRYDAEGCFESDEIILSSEATGRIICLDVREGESVVKGQVFGEIDSLQLYLAKLQLEKSRMSVSSSRPDVRSQMSALRHQLAALEKERSRVAALLADNAATAQQMDEIEAKTAVLKAQISAQESALVNSTKSIDAQSSSLDMQIAQLEDQLAKCRITSPVNGTVLAKYLHEGEFAAAGRPVLRVADLENIYLRVYLTSTQLSEIKIGQNVKVFADFGGNKIHEYEGCVEWISPKSEFTPKSIQTSDERENLVYAVKVAVKNDGFIKLGMYGGIRY